MGNLDNRISIQEAAMKLGLTRETVMRRLATGDLKGDKDGLSSRWYVTRESVDRYITEHGYAELNP